MSEPNTQPNPAPAPNPTPAPNPQAGPLPGAGKDQVRAFFASVRDLLKGLGSRANGVKSARQTPRQQEPKSQPDTRSAIERMRDKVAEFDEDYKDGGERFLGAFMSFIGYVGPFLLMAWIGSDLGRFFESTMGRIPAYGLAYTVEGIIAGCTIAMGRAFGDIQSGKPAWGKCLSIGLIWLVLNASSAFGLYLVITNDNQIAQGGLEQLSMVIRVVAVALGDLGCSAVLSMKGRSLAKHIESIQKKAEAIESLASAQRKIEEADKNAQLRDQMMKSTLKIQEDLSQKIGEAVSMVMESILERMETALKEDAKNERGYGRR